MVGHHDPEYTTDTVSRDEMIKQLFNYYEKNFSLTENNKIYTLEYTPEINSAEDTLENSAPQPQSFQDSTTIYFIDEKKKIVESFL